MAVILVKPRTGNRSASLVRSSPVRVGRTSRMVPVPIGAVKAGADLDTGAGFEFKKGHRLADLTDADRAKVAVWLAMPRIAGGSADVKPTLASLATKLDELLARLASVPAQVSIPAQDPEMPSSAVAVPSGSVVGESAECRLVRLLRAINGAYAEVEEMMPVKSRQFRAGHSFAPETIAEAKRTWFRSSDAIGAMNGRETLRRPQNWAKLRPEVMGDAGVDYVGDDERS